MLPAFTGYRRGVSVAGAFPPPGGLPSPDAPAPVQWGAPQVPPGYQAVPPPGYPPAPPGYPAYAGHPAYAAPQSGTSAYAVLALIFGVFPIGMGALGVIFGIIALERIRSLGHSGKGLAIAGIIVGSLWLVVLLISAVALLAGS